MQIHRDATVRRTTRQKASKYNPAPVQTITVNRGVWAKALEIAGGDPRRITILGPTKVEIR